ncbi:formin-J isoform X2 [Topomyia yanbarensis]|uniref:formin-J isoform X2 n=1 Tax=Topomyia yanbarensis TaxID=2498891 RepID=UPI00273C0AA2|nr:formin-J isoform X2 [Topomyia yanbarensis]
MWNKLFKSKSKSSKNLSGNGSTSTAPFSPQSLDYSVVPINNINNNGINARYDEYHPDSVVFRYNDQAMRQEQNRDSIGTQMCGIPMRKSKFSSAFKSLSLRRGSTKNQLKLYPAGTTGDIPIATDEIHVSSSSKRASLRPSKSDNNLNEKEQQYVDQEKDDPVYDEQYKPVVDPFLQIPEPPPNLELRQCPICSRNFVPPSLSKHISICERMQTKKRKPFDSSRQRREGTDLASYLPKNFGLPHNHPQARVSPPKTTNPIRKLSTSKTPTMERKDYMGVSHANNNMSKSQTLPSTSSTGDSSCTATTTPRPTLKRSLSQQNEPCPYCERCFGFKAYDRHVEWCREKALLNKNIHNSQTISAAKERLNARIQYKAPQISGTNAKCFIPSRSKRALNREKYSGSLSCGGSTNSLADLDLPLPRHHRSHLNSMSSSISSDNKSDHSGSLKKAPSIGQFNTATASKAAKVTKKIRANLMENENFRNDFGNDQQGHGTNNFGNNLIIRPAQDVRREKEQSVGKLERVGHGEHRVPLKRGANKNVKCNKSGYSPDRYDPFLSAKRQLEELFSPTSGYTTSTPRQQTPNNHVTTPVTPTAAMSKSVTTPTNKTSPIISSNFRRASSLRMPRKVSRPMYIEKAKSNIQKGITDDGPVSPNFLKSSEYDEIPIKSAFNALQMAEKPKMRDSSTTRKNLKLEIKDPNRPATDLHLSKTDSLAAFLKYEHELNLAAMSEKDKKDKSNSLSKRSSSLGGQERKDAMLYANVTGNGLKSEQTPRDEKEKSEQILQDIQPFKKHPQKLVPIKLEPINISYNNNNSHNHNSNIKNNINNNTNKHTNNNNDSNSSRNVISKPTVISLDAILGKKPKPLPEDKENRKESNLIDAQSINNRDNLTVIATKISSSESDSSVKTLEVLQPTPGPNRLAELSSSSTETASSDNSRVEVPPKIDNRLNDSSTKSESADKRPTLTRQNGTTSASSSRDASREESPAEQQPHNILTKNQSQSDDVKPQTPDVPGLERKIPKPSTPITVQKKPERPPLPSFDDFDFDEFISSFEEERRSFKNAFYSRNVKPSSSSSNSSNSNRNINQHANITNNDSPTNVKSVASLNGSNSSTGSPSHFTSPNSHPDYKSFDNHARSEGVDTTRQMLQPQQSQEPPQVPRRQFPTEQIQATSNHTTRNLPSIVTNPGTVPVEAPSSDTKSHKTDRMAPIVGYGLHNDNNNNMNGSPLTVRTNPFVSRHSNGNNFNHHPSTVPQQPYQQHASPVNNNNTISTRLVPQTYTTPSPLFEHTATRQSPLGTVNGVGNTVGGNGTGGGGSGGRIMFDDLSPTERDLMKSVQELDRMCESSSSMYPADSDEVSSVEGYPLSNSTRGHHHETGGRSHQRPSAEGSKFSADSAYGSLSRQSPPEPQHHTIRRAYHHRSGKSTTTSQQQDPFDNSSGSESSLPPITATLKTQKVELHSHKESRVGGPVVPMSKFCHECGSRFTINTAKFCMECGIRRIMLD